jgi:hypothetical protein
MKTIKSKLKSTRITRDRASDALKYTSALDMALTVFEKTLAGVPIPGLKGAVGGIFELANGVSARWLIVLSCSAVHKYPDAISNLGGCP